MKKLDEPKAVGIFEGPGVGSLGVWLRAARGVRGLSREGLGEKAGLSGSTIRYVEGGGNPTFEILEKILVGLGCRFRIKLAD